MAWDLRAALLKKGEIESARLDAFAFRERARTWRLLGEELGRGIDPRELASRIAVQDDDAILRDLVLALPDMAPDLIRATFDRCREAARRSLIAEIGDPTPHRLA